MSKVTELPNVTLVREVGSNQSSGVAPFYSWQPVADPGDNNGTGRPVTHSYGDWEEATAENATHAVLDLTIWSDYSGSTVERSNERSILSAYPGVFIQLYGGHGTSGLMMPVEMPESFRADDDSETREEWWQYLLDELAALSDYPVYDEDDLSALEMELADEAWDDYLQYYVSRDLESRGVPEEAIDNDAIRDRFYAITRDDDYGPEAESAVSMVFPFYEQTLDTIARELGASND